MRGPADWAPQDHSGPADVLPGVHRQPERFIDDPATASGRERPPQRLRILQPSLKVIVSTGYSQEMARLSASHERDLTFLAKPYETRALALAVRECLDRP